MGGSFTPRTISFANPSAPASPSLGAGVAPVGAPGSIGNAGSYTPDWASLIQNDPGFLQDQSTLSASGIANASQRDALMQTALVNFGGNVDMNAVAKTLGVDPSSLSNLDPATVQALAHQNDVAGTSTQSRLDAANTLATRGIKNALNARGLLNSGETGYQLGQQQQSYTQAQYDARQKLTDYMTQYQQGYLTGQQQLNQSLSTAASSAADRQYANNTGSAGTTANYSYTDAAGTHVYADSNGNLFNPDGTPYAAPAAPAPTPTAAPVQQPWNPQPGIAPGVRAPQAFAY